MGRYELVGWLVGKGINSLKKRGFFPLISPKWIPDGLVGLLVGERIESVKEEGSSLSSPVHGCLRG